MKKSTSNTDYQWLFNDHPDALMILRPSGQILDANTMAVQRYGYSLDELLSMSVSDLALPDLRDQVADHIKTALGSGDQFEWQHVRKDGRQIQVEIAARPIVHNGEPAILASVRDITARKEALLEREKERHTLQRMLELESGTVYVYDLELRKAVYLNKHWKLALGYTPEESLEIGDRPTARIFHADDLPRLAAHREAWKDAPDGEYRSIEFRVVDKSGDWHCITSRETPFLRSEAGEVRQVLGVAHDITAKKKREQERKHSAELMTDMSHMAEIGAWEMDVATGDFSYDDESARIHGVAPGTQVTRENVRPSFVGEYQTVVFNATQNAIKSGQSYDLELEYITPQGDRKWLRTIGRPVMVGDRTIKLRGASQDITAKKQLEMNLKREAESLRTAQRIAKIGSWEYGPNAETVWSDEMYRINGVEKGVFKPTASRSLALTHPEDRAAMREWHRASLAGEMPGPLEFRVVLRGGTTRYISARSDLVSDPQSNTPYMTGTSQDITAHKLAEEALRNARDFAENLIDTANVIFVRLDGEGNVLQMNDVAEKITGYNETELIGKSWFETLVPKQRFPEVWDLFEQINSTGETPELFENPILTRDGEERQIIWKTNTVTENNEVIGTISFGMDISDRKSTEIALLESERRLQMTLGLSGIGLWDWDLQKDVWYSTPTYFEMLKYSPTKEAQDWKIWAERIHPDDREFLIGKGNSIRSGAEDSYSVEYRLRDADGTYRWINSIGHTIERDAKGRAARMLGLQIDITERRQAEETIQQNMAELASLNSLSKDVNTSLQLDQVVQTIVNSSINAVRPDLAMLFLREGDKLRLLGSATQGVPICHAATPVHQIGQCLCGLAVAQGQALYSRDIHSDSRCTWTECKKAGVHSFAALPLRVGKKVIGVLALASGTDRDYESQATFLDTFAEQAAAGLQKAHLQDQIERHAEELEKRVAKRTAQLENAKEQAEQSDHVKSAFLATMSHELRTPLNSIIGFTGALLQGLAGPTNEEQNKQLSIVKKSGQHLLELISDVLDISKIEAGDLHITFETVDIEKLLQRTDDKFRPQAESQGLEFILDIGPDVGSITSNSRRLEQILNNLVSNALKFTEQGTIQLSCYRDEDSIRMELKDTGVGISPKDCNRIFEEFVQIENRASTLNKGTGLGLAITRHLVSALGGQVGVESHLGVGSTFFFSIPIQRKVA